MNIYIYSLYSLIYLNFQTLPQKASFKEVGRSEEKILNINANKIKFLMVLNGIL